MEQKTREAILVALKAFSENFRKETTKQLTVIWLKSLGDLSMEAILKGTRRCLTECNYYPTIKEFREKALTNTPSDRAGQWRETPQIEHTENKIKMPADFKQQLKKLVAGAKQDDWTNKGLNAMPHEGEENGSKFRITRDARGREYVFYYGRPELYEQRVDD